MSQEELNINSLKELSERVIFSQGKISLKSLDGAMIIHDEPLSAEGLENIIYLFYNRKEDTKVDDSDFGKTLSKNFPAYKRHTWSDNAWKQIMFRKNDTFLQPDYRGNLVVKKGSQRLLVLPGNYLLVNDTNGSPFVTLSYPSVLSEKVTTESYTWIFGNYYCADIDDNPNDVRFYFNIKPSSKAIINVTEQIKKKFDIWGVPYRFKFLNNLLFFSRADSGVMYVSQKYFFIALHLIKQICDDERTQEKYLNKDVPHFTYKVTDGIGFAEEPITNQAKLYSFGTWTAHKISESIIDILGGYLNDKVFPKFEHIQDKFKDYLSQSHLNPSSNFPYSFDWVNQNQDVMQSRRGEDIIFGEANTIARVLCGEAFWIDKNQCTWLTFGRVNKSYCFKSIDDSLMKGRAGIALFLASMYSHNPDRLFRHIAICTLNTVIENIQLDSLNQEKVNNELAFWQGLHFTFDQAGRIFNENSFTEIAKKIASFLGKKTIIASQEPNLDEIPKMPAGNFHIRYKRMRKVITSSSPMKKNFDKNLLADIKEQYLDRIKPYPNSLLLGDANVNNEEFCPTLSQGLACVGYFFLKMSDQPNVLSIPYEFIDAS